MPETGRAPSVADTHALPIIYLPSIKPEALPELVWAVDGFVTEPGVTFVAGAAKSGKSQFVIRMLVALASGRPFLDGFEIPRRRKVLYLSGEDWFPNIYRRIRTHAFDMGFESETEVREEVYPNIQIIPVCGLRLDEQKHVRLLNDALEKLNYDVVVVDPLARFHHLDEDKSSGMAPVLRTFREIGDSRIVIVVHHEGKRLEGGFSRVASLGHRSRGTSAFADLHDNYIAITRTKTGFKVEREHKYAASPEPMDISVQWEDGNVHWSMEQPINIVTLPGRIETYVGVNPGCSTQEIKSGITGRAQNIVTALDSLQAEGKLRVVEDGQRKLWYLA